ncbi:hypothetical protein RRG08_027990 [Elysia crispata]|uniref:Uncharacterized protein n=1 Tax=Elysia crispata TaxID=231223 RepID=A0AAE1EEM7_9GAST|nr:hypothetical protein RRG08_027990 [Elysia crispata]
MFLQWSHIKVSDLRSQEVFIIGQTAPRPTIVAFKDTPFRPSLSIRGYVFDIPEKKQLASDIFQPLCVATAAHSIHEHSQCQTLEQQYQHPQP